MENELYKKLENNYKNEIKQYLDFLRTKGYVLTPTDDGNQIWKYNARINDFYKAYTTTDIIRDIQEKTPNYFDIVFSDFNYNELIEEVFPIVTIDDIDNFRKYNEAITKVKDPKTNEKDLKDLLTHIKKKKAPVSKTAPKDFNEQIQALTNEGVIYCHYNDGFALKRNGLFKYNKTNDKWDLLTLSDIANILEKAFSTPFDTQTIKTHLKKFHNGLIYSSVPYQYNQQKEYQEIIKNYNNPNLDGSQWV